MFIPSRMIPCLAALLLSLSGSAGADPASHAKWEAEIAAIEARDKASPPPTGGILFVGSSTIRMWKTLAADFPGRKVINHGFGGSQIADATYFAPRIVFPCAPGVIFLRSGTNDINAGKSPEQVFKDYLEFVATVRAKLPETRIVYLGLCPTIARIREVPQGNILNRLVKEHAAKDRLLGYVDCEDMTVGPDGKPRPELFIADGLHLSDAGYKLLAERTRPYLPGPVKIPTPVPSRE